eukprot:TRINITY_DN4984_c1_g2_i1.p1 TRINITY_DN4984_c1_g2~~TRINITY_DN4984_c1_g2_i1.p1  ORF type:complete len:482 (-),score=94.35 TRINITY_DN4984_c1_g2_i1:178-1623(-)
MKPTQKLALAFEMFVGVGLSLQVLRGLPIPVLNKLFTRVERALKSVFSYYLPRPSRHGILLVTSDEQVKVRVDKEWLQRVLENHIKSGKGWKRNENPPLGEELPLIESIEIPDKNVGWGLSSSLFQINVKWAGANHENFPTSFVVKWIPTHFDKKKISISLGSSREALFYNWLHEEKEHIFDDILPQSFYAYGSQFSGDFVLLTENLDNEDRILSRAILGNQCWPKVDIPEKFNIDQGYLLEVIFLKYADINARFWRDKRLLQNSWMKAVDWIQGKERGSWELAMAAMASMWRECVDSGKTKDWSVEVVTQMDVALQHTSWANFRNSFDIHDVTTPFTLCHGDFHAGNLIWAGGNEPHPFFLLDWTEVGVFCPFTDLAQFIISNATIELRRREELRLFKAYYAKLISNGVNPEVFTFDACWNRYVKGGIEKWLQLLVLMTARNFIDANAAKWFHDQLQSFIVDHCKNGPLKISFMTAYCFY